MKTKAAKAITAGDTILLNGEWVTVASTARTFENAGDVAITNEAGWTVFARPNAPIPTRA